MKTPLLVRRATLTDAKQIIGGINSICSEGGAFYTTQFIPTQEWETVLYHPSTAVDLFLAVAEWNGEFAGVVRLFPGNKRTLIHHVAELGLFVLKPFRRRGIGTQLLISAIEWAFRKDLEKITLAVFATNLPAISLYQKFDFIEEGRQVGQIKTIGKEYTDLVLMSYFLSSLTHKKLTTIRDSW